MPRDDVRGSAPPPVRLAELVAGLSGVADLGMGLPLGSAARSAGLAVEVAERLGCSRDEIAGVFWAGLLQHIGCTAYSHELSALFPDETAIKRISLATDFTRPPEIVLGYLPSVVAAAPPGERLHSLGSVLLHSRSMTRSYRAANCEAAALVSGRLGLPDDTRVGLLDVFEWWNGGGGPRGCSGEEISVVSRVVNAAGYAVFFDRLGGPDAVRRALAQRSGRYLDPAVVGGPGPPSRRTARPARRRELLRPVARRRAAAAPTWCPGGGLDDVLRVFGETADLKTPFLHGHCRRYRGWPTVPVDASGCPSRRWASPGRPGWSRTSAGSRSRRRSGSTPGRWGPTPGSRSGCTRIRASRYSPAALPRRLARLAGSHHEHLDGSGYHRAAVAVQLPRRAGLVAADRYTALVAERPAPRRLVAARPPGPACGPARGRHLDPDAVQAVIAAAEGRTRAVHAPPGGADRAPGRGAPGAGGRTVQPWDRELPGHLAADRRAPCAGRLHPIGVTSRAAAALFAMEHGLLGPSRG